MTDAQQRLRAEDLLAHLDWIRRLAAGLVRDPALADDLSQEACLVALESPGPRGNGAVRAWLASVVRNVARQVGRGEARRQDHERRNPGSGQSPSTDSLLEKLALQREVVDAVAALEEPFRSTILLRYSEELTPTQIAERTGVPLATVKSRLQRGLARLQVRLRADRGLDTRALLLLATPAWKPSAAIGAGGAVLMSSKTLVTAAVAAGVLVLAGVGYGLRGDPAQPERGAVAAASTPETLRAPETPQPQPRTEQREPEVASAPVAAAAQPEPVPVAETDWQLVGRVLDLDARPVSGVAIVREARAKLNRAAAEAVDRRVLTHSAADGSFLCDWDSGSGRLVASDERWTPVLAGVVFGNVPSAELVLVVAPHSPQSGRIVDEQGRPIPGAHVRLVMEGDLRSNFDEVLDQSEAVMFRTKSDANGLFELPDAPGAPGNRLIVRCAGYLLERVELGADSKLDHEIVLKSSGTDPNILLGYVLDSSGRPVEGAQVALGHACAKSAEDGLFQLDLSGRALDPVSTGEGLWETPTTLRAVVEGHQPAVLEQPANGWPNPVELVLGGPPLAIAGRVVDGRGEPVADASVWLSDTTYFGWVSRETPRGTLQMEADIESLVGGRLYRGDVRTDDDGTFEFTGLLPREYHLGVTDRASLAQDVSQPIAAGTTGVTLRLPEIELIRVAGRVVSESERPQAGLTVTPSRSHESGEGWSSLAGVNGEAVTTDADGLFEFDALCADGLDLNVWGGPMTMPVGYHARPSDDLEDIEIRILLRCHLRVRLADASFADRFDLLDAEGELLRLSQAEGSFVMMNVTGSFNEEGLSPAFGVDETARTLVLYKDDVELARRDITLDPGDVTVIDW